MNEDEKINEDILILENLQKGLSTIKEPPNPMDKVEESLARFVDDAFEVTRAEFSFSKKVQDHILTRLDNFSENQLIALVSNAGVNSADKISKTMNPWVQLATARQQAQIAAESAERTAQIQTGNSPTLISGNSLKDANQSATKEVLQGMDALSKLISFATSSAKKQIEEETLSEVETTLPDNTTS